MTHNQHTTTTVQVQMNGRTILDCIMHKLPSSRKYYRVTLIVPDNGIPIIEYHQASAFKKPKKAIQFTDLLFADRKHDINEKFAFSIYTIDKTITFLAQDETTMNEWLGKIKECHQNLYPEFKRYDSIFEVNLSDKGLAKTMNIQGPYRLALCKESLDLIPLLTAPLLLSKQQTSTSGSSAATSTTTTISSNTTGSNSHQSHYETKLPDIHHHHHHHSQSTVSHPLNGSPAITSHVNHHHLLPQHLSHHQRFHKRHPLLSSKTIELVLRSIRRCGHTDCNFYIESGRHSQIGEGDLWMTLNKKSTARQLHELLLATMKLASASDDQFLYKAPRSRSGSSSDNAHRSQQSRSFSLVSLTSDQTSTTPPNSSSLTNSNNNNSYQNNHATIVAAATISATISTIPMLTTKNNNNIDEDSGYLPMA